MAKRVVTLKAGDEITIKISKTKTSKVVKTTTPEVDMKVKIYKEIEKRTKKGLKLDSSDIATKLGCKRTTVAACMAHNTMRSRKSSN